MASKPKTPSEAQPFSGYKGNVSCIEYSPDGQIIATGCSDGIIQLWNARTGSLSWEFKPSEPVYSLAFAHSGRRLAAICAMPRAGVAHVFMWSLGDEAEGNSSCRDLKTSYDTDGRAASGAHIVTFSSDDKHVAVLMPTLVALQDALTGSMTHELFRANKSCRLESLLAFTAANRKVLFAHRERSRSGLLHVRSFDLVSKEQENLELSLPPSSLLRPPLASSYDGTVVAGALSHDGILVWDTETGSLLHGPLRGQTDTTTCICFLLNGKWIVGRSSDKYICVWDSSTDEPAFGPLKHRSQRSVTAVACSPVGDHVVCVDDDNSIHVWDIPEEKSILSSVPDNGDHRSPLLHSTYARVKSILWFPDGSHFISSSEDDYIVTWDAYTGKQVREFLFPGGSHIALSTDGAFLAVGSLRKPGKVVLLDVKTGEEQASLLEIQSKTRRIEFSPDNSTLAILMEESNSLELICNVFDQHHRKVEKIQSAEPVIDVAFSPDGERFAYATLGNGGIFVCALGTRVVTMHFPTHLSSPAQSLVFSPDGRLLLGCLDLNTVTLWDLATTQPILHVPRKPTRNTMAAFSPDGIAILLDWRDNEHRSGVEMFSVASGERLWRMAQASDVSAFAFSPGGDKIVVGFKPGSLSVYDAQTGRAILPKKRVRAAEATKNVGKEGRENRVKSRRSRPDQQRRAAGLDDLDEDSILNLPAASNLAGSGRSPSNGRQNLSDGNPRGFNKAFHFPPFANHITLPFWPAYSPLAAGYQTHRRCSVPAWPPQVREEINLNEKTKARQPHLARHLRNPLAHPPRAMLLVL
ncbi:WD40 repeat-like protein [Coniophora puteana RWD-64-598 SS2]|uniref:WD40 repeat-like protein n=1 Tax=Coniophora puteana (strain RWD-64-598) TaxID=741705 RepID=A0A5M3MGX9_CONPW|nr:WD40 repeat-like protein [Coniophora puteana RWD-64-598 SS2]EIW78200.1 WD40 repeat-like protein [Coniophora puteana RWD-64-598 SS2]